MENQYEVTLSYRIKYETKEPVPIHEVIAALESLEGLLQNAGTLLSDISNVEVLGHKIYIEKIETGSLIEDIIVKVICGDKEKYDQFLKWLHDTNMRSIIIGVLLGGAITYGVNTLNKNNTQVAPAMSSQISNSPNATIINFPQGMVDQKLVEAVNKAVAERISNKNEMAKHTLNFFQPTRNDPGAYVSLGEDNARAEIPASTIKQIPKKYQAKKNNRFEDLNGVTIKLRAADLDSKKNGWAGSVEGMTNRIKLELDPILEPTELYGKDSITADITLERDFSAKDNKLIPKRIIVRQIYR